MNEVAEPARHLSLRRLKWIAILGPVVFVALLELVVQLLYPSLLSWPGRIVMAGVVVMGMMFFYGFVFELLGRMQAALERQNRELLALHHAAIDIYGQLSLDVVLRRVVEQSARLLDARYGAVSVIDDRGVIQEFVTTGISSEERAHIGDPPQGKGLLGVVLREGQHLRLTDLTADGRSAGFPEHHPPMRSLLAVPVLAKGPFRGNLYLAEKLDGREFTREDEETLVRFASAAAIAIDNADLHQKVQDLAVAEERALIAREMHDGMAQVLAYVNTKAQAVETLIGRGRIGEAEEQLRQLAGAAREVYTDVREGIFALRSQPRGERSFEQVLVDFLETWHKQAEVEFELDFDGSVSIGPSAELQVLRIIQESLSNVRKHARASTVRVEVARRSNLLVASVRDDGVGFDPAGVQRGPTGIPRFGLSVMRERAESVGGSLEILSRLGEGTRVVVELPIVS